MASSSAPPLPSVPPSTRPPIISSTGVISPSSALALVSHSASKALSPIVPDSRTRRLLKATWPWVWRVGMVAALVYTAVLFWRRRKRRARQKTVERSYQLFGTAVRFGLDIGGTLSKVVYFEPEITVSPAQSMLKARVSAFIRRSHSYGVTGRRDSELEVRLHPIKGTLHFLKFQTSMMPNFICIVRENELSPQRPLKEGGGSDDLDEADAQQTNGRRNNGGNGGHHHHHHVHSHAQLPAHPSQMARSYSAAWRSEDEFRQQYLNPMPPGSATPSGTTRHEPIADMPMLISREEERKTTSDTRAGVTPDPTDSTYPQHPYPSPHPHPSSHPAEPILQQTDSNSAGSGDSTPEGGRACTITPRPPVVSAIDPIAPPDTVAAGATNGPLSSRGATPSSDSTSNSVSCPSSPLTGVSRQLSVDRSSTRYHHSLAPSFSAASSTSSSLPAGSDLHPTISGASSSPLSPPQAASSSFEPFLQSLPPKRLVEPTPTPISGPVPPSVCATGGGAFKFEKLFRDELHVTLHKEDELRALVKGIDFMIHSCADECYFLSQYRFREPIEKSVYPSSSISYPYLVVNIGSGVSILKVSGPSSFERVGGTSLGGGTFYGLTRALTGCTSFEEALQMAELGRSGTADLLVGDIYGGDYDGIGLSADTVAASFGKLVRGDALKDVRKEDLAKAALVMITNNIGSLANLYARKVLNVPQMIFVGNFLNSNDIAKRGLAFATEYWSQGQAKALFLTHEGYFGAVGSLLGDS